MRYRIIKAFIKQPSHFMAFRELIPVYNNSVHLPQFFSFSHVYNVKLLKSRSSTFEKNEKHCYNDRGTYLFMENNNKQKEVEDGHTDTLTSKKSVNKRQKASATQKRSNNEGSGEASTEVEVEHTDTLTSKKPVNKKQKVSAAQKKSDNDGSGKASVEVEDEHLDTLKSKEPVNKKQKRSVTQKKSKNEGSEKASTEVDDEDTDTLRSEEPVDKKQKRSASKSNNEGSGKASMAKKTKSTKGAKEKVAKAKKSEIKSTLMNATETKWEHIDFGCNKKNAKGEDYNVKITSWNVDGIRAWLKKGGLSILDYDKPDIFCLQETKCSEDKLPEELTDIEDYHSYWCSSEQEGYAGVGVYSKIEPINVKFGIGEEKHDIEGRCITLEYKSFYLVNVYVPNAGRGLVTLPKRLEWNESFKAYLKKLDKKKPVIVCGDMNVAHNEIDLTNPKSNKRNAGFTQEERDGMTDLLQDGFADSFRELYPDVKDVYTFWSYMSKARSKNVGWRLDYFIVSRRIMENICENAVRSEVFGSDHCPITLFINI